MKKILVTGGSGLVGSRFVELTSEKYHLIIPHYPEFDLTDRGSIKKIVGKEKPDVIVNFAAYTDVSAAENERDNKEGVCWKVNVEGLKNLVAEVDLKKTHFIHISTDYVFPGSYEDPGPHKETDIPESNSSKITWYGFSKAEGERIVNTSFGDARTILRLVYPVRAKYPPKLDYLRKPLSLFDRGKLYPLFSDQQVTISFIDEISLTLERIIDGEVFGVFHASTPDLSSPYELVSYLIEKARGKKNAVKKASLDDFLKDPKNSPVRYAKYGGLKVEETEKVLGIKFSPWRVVIDSLIKQGLD